MLVSKELTLLGAVLFLSSSIPVAKCDTILPGLLGKYPVGTTSFELINTASSPQRDLMLYAYYPITDNSSQQYPLARAFSATFGKWLDGYQNFTDSSTIITRAHLSAPISSSEFPILLFGPGYGEPVRFSGGQTMANLASQGYVVIGVDHPNDSGFIEYPDGRVAYYEELKNITNADELLPLVYGRVSDMNFITSHLRNISFQMIPGLDHELDFENLGILGFSLGGAAAALAMLTNPLYTCGANLDGQFFGNVTELGLDKPFLMMASISHTSSVDSTWEIFYKNLRGYKKFLQVIRTRHKSYSDWLILKSILVKNDTNPANVNLIPGTRMLQIESAYLTSFFDKCLKNGTGTLLEGNSTKFPEVLFIS